MYLRQSGQVVGRGVLDQVRPDDARVMDEMGDVVFFSDLAGSLRGSIRIKKIGQNIDNVWIIRRIPRNIDDGVMARQQPFGQIAANTLVCSGDDSRQVHISTIARTRSGLPVPFLIFKGAAISTAPVGGSLSRLVRHCRPFT